ncbi:MAG: 2-hydroxyacid dehydrogenase [Clostridia bacterium]|nr:2-hydroxyacid dehydrogenase [Clostridia bacterium]
MKIAFFDTKPYDKEMFDKHNRCYGFEINYFETKLNVETALLTKGYEVVCVFVNDKVDSNTIDILYECGVKLIVLRCAGYNNVDIAYAKDKILIARVPEYSPYAVAEHAVALILGLNRKIYKAYQRVKKYNFTLNGLLGFDINGKTVGVIGTGKIGKVFIKIMKGFGANVLAYDVYPDNEYAEKMGYKYTTLEDIYVNSDIISLHCPLTNETEHMININTMNMMKNGVYIINTSRGKLINTKDLVDVLKTGKIGGLALDVYEEESDYFQNDMSNSYLRDEELSVLISMPNVLITSHQAFFTQEALNNIAHETLENIKLIFLNEKCKNIIEY